MDVKKQGGAPPLGFSQPNSSSSSLASKVAEGISDHHQAFSHRINPTTETLGRDHADTDPDPPSAAAAAVSPVRYGECLKNHAAKSGGHVLDGCCEFMASGDDGAAESLKCAACECHRSFHRREPAAEAPPTLIYCYPYNHNSRCSVSDAVVPSAPPAGLPVAPIAPMLMFGAPAESSSEDLDMYYAEGSGRQPKKRFRTKFSREQKMKMMEFAVKLGWKIQKQDEDEVQRFCGEVGVKRQVFKVWMHNNKQAMKNN